MELVNQSIDSVQKDSINLSSKALFVKENIPEIEVKSFSSIYIHDNSEKVLRYLFCWDNIPGSETQELVNYLKNDLGIDWVSTATIIKAADNNTIRVFTPTKSLELKLADDKNTVLITPKHIQLKVNMENSKLRIYKDVEFKYIESKNITEKHYAVYGLSIKNNGSSNFDFILNELHVRDGDHIFNTTIEPRSQYSFVEVLSDLDKEAKIKDTTLFPGQKINGSVVFEVNSLYNKSFLLMYNETPITSASFEKSIEALRTAEQYNYSVVFGIPPYNNGSLDDNFFEPDLKEYPYIWANLVNRSVFEVLNKANMELFNKDISVYMAESSIHFIPGTEFVYALKVMPERNITLKLERNITYDPESYPKNQLIVVDDTGEELINTSSIGKIAILKNQTYELHSVEDISVPQINFSNVTIVRISFMNEYRWATISSVNQDMIMDKEMNIITARNRNLNFMS